MKTVRNPAGSTAELLREWDEALQQNQARVFSIDEAKRMLPLVRRITRDVLVLSRSVRHLRFRLKFIARGGDELEQMFPSEIRALRSRLQQESQRLAECTGELLELGIEPEAPTLGLVDFPAIIDDQAVYLCWRHDEPDIAWWHPLAGGFVDRRPLSELFGDANIGQPVASGMPNRAGHGS